MQNGSWGHSASILGLLFCLHRCYSQILYPLPMSVFSLTIFSGQVQKTSSCDLNFQLCLWFSHVCIQPLHPSWLLCRKDLASELWFLWLRFILICISFVSASHKPPSHPARNPQVVQASSILSQTLLFNNQIYSLNQGNLFYCLDTSVIHLEHKYDCMTPLVKIPNRIYEFKSSQLAPAILFSFLASWADEQLCVSETRTIYGEFLVLWTMW